MDEGARGGVRQELAVAQAGERRQRVDGRVHDDLLEREVEELAAGHGAGVEERAGCREGQEGAAPLGLVGHRVGRCGGVGPGLADGHGAHAGVHAVEGPARVQAVARRGCEAAWPRRRGVVGFADFVHGAHPVLDEEERARAVEALDEGPERADGVRGFGGDDEVLDDVRRGFRTGVCFGSGAWWD